MSESGLSIVVALAQAMTEPSYEATVRMPENGVVMNWEAVRLGMSARHFVAYAASTVESDFESAGQTEAFISEFTPYRMDGAPEVECRAVPLWRWEEEEEEQALDSLRITIHVDGEEVCAAYIKMASTDSAGENDRK